MTTDMQPGYQKAHETFTRDETIAEIERRSGGRVILWADFIHPRDDYLAMVLVGGFEGEPDKWVVWDVNTELNDEAKGGYTFTGNYIRGTENEARIEFTKRFLKVNSHWVQTVQNG